MNTLKPSYAQAAEIKKVLFLHQESQIPGTLS